MTTTEKIYIKYCRPFKDKDDHPPIAEVWSDGERPKKKMADALTLFVYDSQRVDGKLMALNERLWDGCE